MKEATIGLQSREKVISAWPFKSSAGTTTYETQLHSDGVITCNCPGWVRQIDKNTGLRACKHCREVKFEATLILQGRKPPVFKHEGGGVVEKKVLVPQVKVVEKVIEKIVEKKVYVKDPTFEIRGKRMLRAIPSENEEEKK